MEPGAAEGLSYRGKHWRLWVGMDGIVRAIVEADHDRASAEEILEALGDVASKLPARPFRLLLYAHRSLRLTPDARERFAEACRAHLNLQMAVVRPCPLAKIQARAIARHSGREIPFYESEREALDALGAPTAPAAPRPAAAPRQPEVGVVDHIT